MQPADLLYVSLAQVTVACAVVLHCTNAKLGQDRHLLADASARHVDDGFRVRVRSHVGRLKIARCRSQAAIASLDPSTMDGPCRSVAGKGARCAFVLDLA